MPYVWGATGPAAFDCSGLVQWSYTRIRRYVPRTTWSQRYAGGPVRGHLRRGDLVFAYGDSHVAIYAGHGTVIVSPRAGDVVKREPIWMLPVSATRRIIRRG
jgi:cell wall-associated NlpC family hydrolase